MAFGKVAFFSIACLALVNYSKADCSFDPAPPTSPADPLPDNTAVGTTISVFKIKGTATILASEFLQPTVGREQQKGAFTAVYSQDSSTPDVVDVHLLVGPAFANVVDVNGESSVYTPSLTFVCPIGGTNAVIPDTYKLTITDTNNQAPTFVDVPNIIHFDLSLYNDTLKPILGTFKVDDADFTAANTKVVVSNNAGDTDEVGVKTTSESTEDNSQTTFTVTLNSIVAEGQRNVTLKATNDGVNGAAGQQQIAYHTIQLFFTAPSSAIQQVGAFVMVAILSVVSAFAGKY